MNKKLKDAESIEKLNDPVYFMENIMGVKLTTWQKMYFKFLHLCERKNKKEYRRDMMIAYVIKLKNGKYAAIEHGYGTHIMIEGVDKLLFATLFSSEEEAYEYAKEMDLFEKYGYYVYEDDNGSKYQFYGECITVDSVREIVLEER